MTNYTRRRALIGSATLIGGTLLSPLARGARSRNNGPFVSLVVERPEKLRGLEGRSPWTAERRPRPGRPCRQTGASGASAGAGRGPCWSPGDADARATRLFRAARRSLPGKRYPHAATISSRAPVPGVGLGTIDHLAARVGDHHGPLPRTLPSRRRAVDPVSAASDGHASDPTLCAVVSGRSSTCPPGRPRAAVRPRGHRTADRRGSIEDSTGSGQLSSQLRGRALRFAGRPTSRLALEAMPDLPDQWIPLGNCLLSTQPFLGHGIDQLTEQVDLLATGLDARLRWPEIRSSLVARARERWWGATWVDALHGAIAGSAAPPTLHAPA